MLPDPVDIKPATSSSPAGSTSNWATEASLNKSVIPFQNSFKELTASLLLSWLLKIFWCWSQEPIQSLTLSHTLIFHYSLQKSLSVFKETFPREITLSWKYFTPFALGATPNNDNLVIYTSSNSTQPLPLSGLIQKMESWRYFSYFFKRAEFDISCKLSPPSKVNKPSVFIYTIIPHVLSIITLLAYSADDKLGQYFSYFPRKQDLTFHANHLCLRQFAWNVKTCFLR